MRGSLVSLVTLAMIGVLLLPADSNIAADALPDAWAPYLWLAWPAGLLLAVPVICVEIRERRQASGHAVGTVEEQQKRLGYAARDLADAVRRQWTKEAGLRSLRSPEPIRVRWSSAGRAVAGDLWRVMSADGVAGRPVRVRGDVRQVVDLFRKVKTRQLVIIGEPTAGKSVLALLFTLDLLPDEPVPVLLTLCSWNPHREDLHGWLVRRIVEEYPALANADIYGPDAVARLVADGRVLPVLDGLDEMSEALHPVAVDAIDQIVSDQYPLVVTCRSAEYANAVAQNGRFLAHAAVLEIQPVDIDDAASFLCGADPRPERWQVLLDHLYAHPKSPPAQTLQSPLMIDLARTVYTSSANDPAELLDTTRFADRSDVERYLFDAFLRIVYQNHLTPPGSQPGSSLVQYSPEDAIKWLRFLVDHLSAVGDPDFFWWRLEHAVPRLTRALLKGLVTGLAAGISHGFVFGPGYGLAYALTFGLTAGFAFAFGKTREPSRITIRFRGNGRPLLRRFAAGLAIGFSLISIIAPVNAIGAAVVFTFALATQLWLNTPPDLTSTSSPISALKQDRGAALMLGIGILLALGPATGLAAGPVGGHALVAHHGIAASLTVIIVGTVVGATTGGFFYGRPGVIAFGTAGGSIAWLRFSSGYLAQGSLALLPLEMMFGFIVGGLVVLSRAWGAFAFTRLWLALRGQLPLRLMRFLDDAHRRGVLRQSGTVYQFRHERLHNHIATEPPAPQDEESALAVDADGQSRNGRVDT